MKSLYPIRYEETELHIGTTTSFPNTLFVLLHSTLDITNTTTSAFEKEVVHAVCVVSPKSCLIFRLCIHAYESQPTVTSPSKKSFEIKFGPTLNYYLDKSKQKTQNKQKSQTNRNNIKRTPFCTISIELYFFLYISFKPSLSTRANFA